MRSSITFRCKGRAAQCTETATYGARWDLVVFTVLAEGEPVAGT
jgi:hypothetical protein